MLVVLLSVIALFIYLTGEETVLDGKGNTPLFPGLVPGSIDRIELSMFMGRKAVFERKEGRRWVITEPFRDEARFDMITRILDTLARNTRVEVLLGEEERSLSTKGLDPPELQITFHDHNGSHTLYVGVRDPFRNEIYVMIDGDERLFRTGSNILNLLTQNPESFRDNRIFRIDPLLVKGVSMVGPEGVIMEAVNRRGYWEILAPIRIERASNRILNLISGLTRLDVQSRQYEGPVDEKIREEYGLAGPVFRITLSAGPMSKSAEIAVDGIGKNSDHLCVRDGEDAVVSVSAREWARIPKQLNHYRGREILKPVREDLKQLKIWYGGELTFRLERIPDSNYFEITAPFEAPADNVSDGHQSPIYGFLVQVDGIRIKEFVEDDVKDLGKYGLDPPDLILELGWDEAGSIRKTKILFSKAQDNGLVYATRKEPRRKISVYEVDKKDIEPLYQNALLLRDRRIFPQEIGAVREAAFMRKGKSFAIKRNEGGFFVDDPQSRFQQFLNEMARTQVVKYDPGPYRIDDTRFAGEQLEGTLLLSISDEKEETVKVIIELGARCSEGFYGRISTQKEGVFIIDQEFIAGFARLFDGL